MRVLVVEDDDTFADALTTALTRHRHRVVRARRADEAVPRCRDADIVLLDLGLPDRDGLAALREIRLASSVPLIVVTGRAGDRAELRGLLSGADDYVVKPVRTDVLMARMDAVLRRGTRPLPDRDPVVPVGDVRIDLGRGLVTVAGEAVRLTGREFKVLALLAEQPGAACPRKRILLELWGDTMPSSSCSLNVHVSNIRAKTARPGLVRTLSGIGYRLGL